MPQDFAAPLPHNALIAVTGDDAVAFLHGQFTNDVESLAPGAAQWNGWCSPKGRLLATFLLLKRDAGFLVMLPTEIAPAVIKRLAMFVLRSKVVIRDVTADHRLWGVAGDLSLSRIGIAPEMGPMTSRPSGSRTLVKLDSTRALVIGPGGDGIEGFVVGSEDDWALQLIHAGIPIITAATQDAFVPQMANFELIGGVSFKKGCYPGQEIVARTQYRGILKRRMALAHVATTRRPAPGHAVYSPVFGEQAAGSVVNAAPAPSGGFDLLVVAQIESLNDGRLHVESLQGPALQILSHPAAQAA